MLIRARTLTIVGVTVAVALAALGAAVWILDADEVSAERQVGIATGGPFAALETLERDLDGVAAVGARWIRIDFNWTGAQPDGPGRYEWDEFDRVVEEGRARGLSILGVLAYTPEWAQPPESDDKHPPVELEQYVSFARAAARRFSRRGVHHWELWNEPNLGCCFWKPRADPERYAELVRRATAAIKEVDGSATILAGALAPTDGADPQNLTPAEFTRRFFAADPGSFDALSVHPYTWPSMPTESWPGAWRGVADIAQANGVFRLWGTEFGAPTDGPDRPVSEPEQARMATLAYAAWPSFPLSDGPLFWFSYRDEGTNLTTREDFFGVVRHDFTPKPAWEALRAAAHRDG